MNDFKKQKFSRPTGPSRGGSSRPSFGGGAPRFGGRDSQGSSESFKTSCSKCNKACEVPFKPNGKKPVFCRDCFVRDDAPRAGNDSFQKRSYGSDRAPERSYASSPSTATPDPRITAIQKELQVINDKLDTLMRNLEGSAYASILNRSIDKESTPSDSPKVATTKAKKTPKKIAKKATSKK